MQPRPRLALSTWADRYRHLSPETSAEPGPWRSARVPYITEILDSITDPETEQTVMMSSSQVAKTEVLLNALGYFAHWDPSSVILMQPTIDLMEKFSKERVATMIRDSPALTDTFPSPKSRSSGNTIDHKEFPGGYVAMLGANAPRTLASRPVRVILGDEVDGWPASAGTEGDPLRLVWKRTQTYWNRVGFWCSSPTLKGASRIARLFELGTKERLYVPCHACGHPQVLRWANVHWEEGEPLTARYQCEACDAYWTEAQKVRAHDHCKFIADDGGRGKAIRSFHLSELNSPWSSMARMVKDFLECKNFPELLKTWINTSLGELWEGEGETVDAELLYSSRREPYETVPNAATDITAGVDVQADRFEVEIVAWDRQTRESWSIAYLVIYGDPRIPYGTLGSPWEDLEKTLSEELQLEDGGTTRIRSVMIDAGYLFDEVCSFTRRRERRGWFACRGEAGQGKGWIHATSRNNKPRARVFRLGVDSIKGAIYRYLSVEKPGPGYCHFPDTYELPYFDQLTSESALTRYRSGIPVLVWELSAGVRNEALDCRVYASAALERVAPRKMTIIRATTARTRTPAEEAFESFRGFDQEGGDFIRGR